MYDIAVIGGGPVGSRVAAKLVVQGHRVAVIDRKRSLTEPVCCTGIISIECAQRFDVDRCVISRYASSAKIYSPSGHLFRVERSEPQACVVDRPSFNALFARRAQEKGVEYLLDFQVDKIDIQQQMVRVESENTVPDRKVVEARAVVIASGSNSRLVEYLGLGKPGDFAMGAQAVVETDAVDEIEVYLGKHTAPAFFSWLVPTTSGHALAGLMARSRSGYHLRRLLTRLEVDGKIRSTDVPLSFAAIPLKPIQRTYSDRVLVVGSAAGQVKPTTGGGIYYGLLCADVAAETLHLAKQDNDFSARRLSVYEKEWKKKLGREINTAYRGRKIFEFLSDGQIDLVMDIIKSTGIDKALLSSKEISFDWHGGMVLKIVGNKALAGVFGTVRIPSSIRKRDNIRRLIKK